MTSPPLSYISCVYFLFSRHKELAPQKYVQLEQKLRTDPRLAEHFWSAVDINNCTICISLYLLTVFLINTKWSLDQVWLPVITNHLSMLEKDHNFIIEPTVKSAEIYIWWQRKAKTLHFLSDFIARWVVHWLAKLQFRVLIVVWINKKK